MGLLLTPGLDSICCLTIRRPDFNSILARACRAATSIAPAKRSVDADPAGAQRDVNILALIITNLAIIIPNLLGRVHVLDRKSVSER